MKINFFSVLALTAILFMQCTHSKKEAPGHRIIFNAGDFKVITSAVNKKQKTMSVLFGNAPAVGAALNNANDHQPGEVFTLVTWEEVDNPYWYGATINGKIRLVETIKTSQLANGRLQFDYQIMPGTPSAINEHHAGEADRVSFILSMRPSIFPS